MYGGSRLAVLELRNVLEKKGDKYDEKLIDRKQKGWLLDRRQGTEQKKKEVQAPSLLFNI